MQLRRFVVAAGAAALASAAFGQSAAAQEPAQPAQPEPTPAVSPSEPAPTAAVPEGHDETPPATSTLDVRASTEVSMYADTDHVFVVTPTIAGGVSDPVAGWSVDGRYLLDVVSAASVDIVSTASRRWEEVRHVGALEGAYKPGLWGVKAHGSVSREPDYLSLSGGAALTRDLFDKHLTLLAGFDYGHDNAGKTGTPFSVFSRPLDREAIKLGGTWVVNASTLASLIGDIIVESGDQSKVYRYVPMFAPGVAVPLGANAATVTALRSSARPQERLPLSRDRFALSFQVAHRFAASTVRVDERGYTDTWALKATTTDARYLVDVSERWTIGPHVRVHAQSPVNFWQRAYTLGPGFEIPALRTGDRELGPLLGFTGGGTARWKLGGMDGPFVLGFDLNLTSTHYLDDLYIKQRWSTIGAVSLEVTP